MKNGFYFVKRKKINNELRYYIEDSQNTTLKSLIHLNSNFNFSILEITYNENISIDSENIIEISGDLYKLLYSAKKYSPALVFTEINTIYYAKKINDFSIKSTQKICETLLIHYLENQRKYPFFMARSKTEDFGWLMPNYYYWIVGYDREKNTIQWISDDYIIYDDPLDEFDIKPNLLKKLDGYPQKALRELDKNKKILGIIKDIK